MMEPETSIRFPYSINNLAEGLKKAREFRGFSLKDSCSLMGIPTNRLLNFEKGKYIPSLAELEALSYIYSIPLDALFYPEGYPEIFKVSDADQLQQLLQIRKRIISTTIQIAFEKSGKSIKEVAKAAALSTAKYKRYHDGEVDIPFNELQRIASVLDLDLNTLMDSESQIGQWQEFQKKKIAYAKLPETARAFLTHKENWPYMDVVEQMKRLEPRNLESLAESIRELAKLSPANKETRE